MPFAIYSVLRLALLGLVGVVLYLVGLRSWPLVVVAALLALMISYVVLSRPREAAAVYLAQRREERIAQRATGERGRFSGAVEEDAASEDAHVDGTLGRRDSDGRDSDGQAQAQQ